MNNDDKVSVIIPTYNREKLIAKSIKSVLKQTYKNIEIIVVDDASNDNTMHVVEKIKDKRVKYYRLKKNKGANYARNYGIKHSKGKYITFNDSDDIYDIKKIERQYNNLKSNNSDMDFCKVRIYENDIFVDKPDNDINKLILSGKIVDELCKGNFISTQAIFIKKEILDKNMFDDNIPRWQDYDLLLRIVPNIKVSFTNEVLVDLYRQEDSISNKPEKLIETIKMMLLKDYNLNINQSRLLKEWLLYNSEGMMLDTLDKYYKLRQEYYKLGQDYNKLEEFNKELDNKVNEVETKYYGVINSKRFKIINNLFNFFKH